MSAPHFMKKTNPAPVSRQRLYNGRKLLVWEGKVKTADITGWLDNPRIDLAKKSFQDRVGNRPLTQEEILEIMQSTAEFRLKELRDDILKNGLREPLTLSYSGKLLDGNRRFFAIKYALSTLPATDPNRADLELVDAFVLAEDVSEEDEDNVLVEENFSPSLKIEWPDYVKAQKVIRLKELGLAEQDIAAKLNWPKSKVKETVRISRIVEDFEAFAIDKVDAEDRSMSGLGLSEQEAKTLAAKNYQFFNEAQKSFFAPLESDVDFKLEFFRWIAEGKFNSFAEVRIAHKAYNDAEAKSILARDVVGAAKAAKAALDYNERVVKNADEASGRIESFVKFLRQMEADEIRKLPAKTQKDLKEALDLIRKMSEAAGK